MKKSILVLLGCLSAVSKCFGEYVLWVGVNENVIVHAGGNTFSVTQFANIVGQSMENMGGRILVDEIAMPVGYEVKGATKEDDRVEFDDSTEFSIIMWHDDGVSPYIDENGNYWLVSWQSIKLDNNADIDASVIFELGYWEDDGYGDFVPLAMATDTLENLWNKHTYETFDLNPPIASPWSPIDFYTDYPVPEPSISILFCIDSLMLLLLREL